MREFFDLLTSIYCILFPPFIRKPVTRSQQDLVMKIKLKRMGRK
jgi:hypothetical protein